MKYYKVAHLTSEINKDQANKLKELFNDGYSVVSKTTFSYSSIWVLSKNVTKDEFNSLIEEDKCVPKPLTQEQKDSFNQIIKKSQKKPSLDGLDIAGLISLGIIIIGIISILIHYFNN